MAVRICSKDSKEQLSENFKSYEFDCRCGKCKETKVDDQLTALLQRLRNTLAKHTGKDTPVLINSGFRCEAHNDAVGGAKASYHMKGMAADIRVSGVEPETVAMLAERVGFPGIGLYDSFVHVDTRTTKAFWYSHKQVPRTTFGGAQTGQEDEAVTVTVELPVLRKGDTGSNVKVLQLLLQACGYTVGSYGLDGIFGDATENALLCFQEDRSLNDADGIVGTLEWRALLGL